MNSPSSPSQWITSLCSLSVSSSRRNCHSCTCPLFPLLLPGLPSGMLLASPTRATPSVTGFFFLTWLAAPPAVLPPAPGLELFFWTTATNLHFLNSSRWVQNRSLGSTDTFDLNWSWVMLQRLAPDICQSAGSMEAVLKVLRAQRSQWRTCVSCHWPGSVGMASRSCSLRNWLHTTQRVTVSRSGRWPLPPPDSVSSSDCSSSLGSSAGFSTSTILIWT